MLYIIVFYCGATVIAHVRWTVMKMLKLLLWRTCKGIHTSKKLKEYFENPSDLNGKKNHDEYLYLSIYTDHLMEMNIIDIQKTEFKENQASSFCWIFIAGTQNDAQFARLVCMLENVRACSWWGISSQIWHRESQSS